MAITRCVSFYGKMAALWVVMVIALLFLSFGALCLFTTALLIWLIHYVGPAPAFALTGLLLVLEAIAVFCGCRLALGHMHTKRPNLGSSALGFASLALRVATLTIRRSPRKAVISAALLGALIDYFTSRQDPKK